MAVAKETGPYKWGFLLGLGRFGNIVSATEYFGDVVANVLYEKSVFEILQKLEYTGCLLALNLNPKGKHKNFLKRT